MRRWRFPPKRNACRIALVSQRHESLCSDRSSFTSELSPSEVEVGFQPTSFRRNCQFMASFPSTEIDTRGPQNRPRRVGEREHQEDAEWLCTGSASGDCCDNELLVLKEDRAPSPCLWSVFSLSAQPWHLGVPSLPYLASP